MKSKNQYWIIFILWAILFFFSASSIAQNFSGNWKGVLTQDGKPGSFSYKMEIIQSGEMISGTSVSESEDGKATAVFSFHGIVNEDEIFFQELEQLEPDGVSWCLKSARLKEKLLDGNVILEGNWTAKGCTPGKLVLEQEVNIISKPVKDWVLGNWTGHLTQSDRKYGFYYELEINEGNTGVSYIVSEGNGGSASFQFEWEKSEDSQMVIIRELELLYKTSPKWKWCLKSARLKYGRDKDKRFLKGNWEGFIEGFSQKTGACSPGELYVEMPILEAESPTEETIPKTYTLYESDRQRKVKVSRVINVVDDDIKVRVWDNGIVDGDVLSLYLNGDELLKNYMVSKQKRTINVKLESKVNYFILHAISLGEITPNTVAVSINDGKTEQVVILSSNLETSGAVMVKMFVVE